MKRYFSFILITFFSLVMLSCSKDNTEPVKTTIPHQKIGEGYAAGAAVKVELYARKALFTGYNTLYLALYDSVSSQRIESAQVSLVPMMDMGMMKHSAPVENPSNTATDKLFPSAVVFTMPSDSMGSWTLEINVSLNGKAGKLTLPVTITAPSESRLKSFVSKADNSKFFVAFLEPETPKVGVNDIEIAIFKAQNMTAYPADSSLSVTLVPEMPTMGHGSPNNVDPVHIGKGHYRGKLNFTMTGLWYLNLDFKAGAVVADTTTYFEVNF